MAKEITLKNQHLNEVSKLRNRISELERSKKKLKQAEDALKDAEERFLAITEATPDGIVAADSNGKIIYWNKAAEKIAGYKRSEVIGKPPYFLSPDGKKENEKKRISQIKKGLLPVSGKTYEYSWKRKNGKLFPAETSFASWKSGDHIFISAIFRDITKRKQDEESLRRYQEELELLVKEQTDDLAQTNKHLRQEIEERKQVERVLRERETELQEKSRNLEDINTALKVLLERREVDKFDLYKNIVRNVRELIDPYVERLGKMSLNQNQKTLFDIIKLNLSNITSSFLEKMASQSFLLTPTEIKVAGLVKDGRTNKDIAELLCISLNTTLFHRYNIRRKLGVKNKKINLRSHLMTFEK